MKRINCERFRPGRQLLFLADCVGDEHPACTECVHHEPDADIARASQEAKRLIRDDLVPPGLEGGGVT